MRLNSTVPPRKHHIPPALIAQTSERRKVRGLSLSAAFFRAAFLRGVGVVGCALVVISNGGLAPVEAQSRPPSAERPLSAEKKEVVVSHKPPRPQDLPPPGARMKLSFQLRNTREITQTVNALVTLDGRLLNVIGGEGYLNEYDNPTFEVVTNSPAAEIAYQLIVRSSDGTPIVSPRYAVRRTCVPKLDLTDASIPRDVSGGDRLKALVETTRALEREMAYYDSAIRDVTELKELLDEE